MKKGKLIATMIVLVSLVVGVSGCLGQGKPNKEVLQKLATESLIGVIHENARMAPVIKSIFGPHAAQTVRIDKPEFLNDFSVIEKVRKTDKNGVEREMWMVDIFGLATVIYNEDNQYRRDEAVKYKMFIYKDAKGTYLYEDGVLEEFSVGEFGK